MYVELIYTSGSIET